MMDLTFQFGSKKLLMNKEGKGYMEPLQVALVLGKSQPKAIQIGMLLTENLQLL